MALALTITPQAEEAFMRLSSERKADYVRLSAGQACGCGRIGYQMRWESERSEADEEIPAPGITLLVDLDSRPHLEGGVIDYRKEQWQEGFLISNPHVQSGCSCGSH